MNHDCPTDGDWLRKFVLDQDHQAFADLVRRHAPMVHRLCARLCGTPQDADDAVQQVFITLAAKAATLTARTSLAGWLHRTACHTAARWRQRAANRQAHEFRAAEIRTDRYDGGAGPTADGFADVEAVERLHRALGALPEDYRNAMVLHHLEGHTIEQIAAMLATRPGTVAARLSRGRSMLRARLTVALGVAAVPLAVEEVFADDRAVALPPDVADRIARPRVPYAPTAPAAGPAAATAGAVATATAAPMTFIAHLKAASVLIALSAGAFAASGAVVAYQFIAPAPNGPDTSKPAPVAPPAPSVSETARATGVPEPTGLLWLAPLAFVNRRARDRRPHR